MFVRYIVARIAQLVEQWIEDPRVTSSNLVPGKISKNAFTGRNILFVLYRNLFLPYQ